MTKLDERGLAAARRAHTTFLGSMNGPTITEVVVAAYLSAVDAAEQTAPEVGGVEPVWQYRCRVVRRDGSHGEWDSWREGRKPEFRSDGYEAEERPLYPASALTAQAEEIERLRKLFDECAVARDTAGYIGSVPDCIEALDGETKLLTDRAERAEAALAAAKARLEKADSPTHRHKKRGSEYTLIGIGKMQSDEWYEGLGHEDASASVDMREVTIYRGTDGQMWVRPREEFEDGRFEILAAARYKAGE